MGVSVDTLAVLPHVRTHVQRPMELAVICQHWLIPPERLADAAQVPVPVVEDALCGRLVMQEAARRLVFGLFVLTGWLWTQREIADLRVCKPMLAELLNRHNVTTAGLAQRAGVPVMVVQEMLRRRPVSAELAARVLAGFLGLGFEYQLRDVDVLVR